MDNNQTTRQQQDTIDTLHASCGRPALPDRRGAEQAVHTRYERKLRRPATYITKTIKNTKSNCPTLLSDLSNASDPFCV